MNQRLTGWNIQTIWKNGSRIDLQEKKNNPRFPTQEHRYGNRRIGLYRLSHDVRRVDKVLLIDYCPCGVRVLPLEE